MTQINVSDVLQMLKEGKTRVEIKDHYNLNALEMKKLFQNKNLKGRRTQQTVSFQLIDDVEVNNSVFESPGAISVAQDIQEFPVVEEQDIEEEVTQDVAQEEISNWEN